MAKNPQKNKKLTKNSEEKNIYAYLKIFPSRKRLLYFFIPIAIGLTFFIILRSTIENFSWQYKLLLSLPLGLIFIFFPETEHWVYTPWQSMPVTQEAHENK